MFVSIAMCLFAMYYFARKYDKKYAKKKHQQPIPPASNTQPSLPPPAPNVYVQVIVKDGDVVRVTTQTPV